MKRLGVASLIAALLLPFVSLAGGPAEVRVLTRNIYVGADIFRVINVEPSEVIAEIAAVYQTIEQTDFPARAEALADEILETDPHLIGLQEVSLIRTQSPGDFLFGNPIAAMDVQFDFLQLLLDALAARGLSYQAVAVVENADVEFPLVIDALDDVRLTDRDVILARSDVVVNNVLEQNFENFVSLDLSGIAVEFERGFVAVDALVEGRPYRFVNTHLETGGAFGVAQQILQTPELIAALEDEYLPVILLGDFNASPDDPPEQAYGQLVAAGYTDTWPLAFPLDSGFTCCHPETLDNPTPFLTSRIDIVFVRNPTAPAANVLFTEVLGDEIGDQTPGGLWPSDHAGVFAALSIPVADTDADGFDDLADNCILEANPDQRDTNNDGFGNRCDPDLDDNGTVDFFDVGIFKNSFLLSGDLDTDFDGNGETDFADLDILKAFFLDTPGPAAGL